MLSPRFDVIRKKNLMGQFHEFMIHLLHVLKTKGNSPYISTVEEND